MSAADRLVAQVTPEGAPQEAARSLSELHDIVLPAQVSAWPPAPGWWMLLAALVVSAGILTWRVVLRHRALAYRRAALDELRELCARGELARLPALLKRVALAVHRRGEVASLSGTHWRRFLDRTGGPGGFSEAAGRSLSELAYAGERARVEGEAAHELTVAAGTWIRAQGPADGERSP